MRSQRRSTRSIQRQLLEHARTRLLECIGTVLTFAVVVIVDDEALQEHIDERLKLQHVLLVGIGHDHDGYANEVRHHILCWRF